MTVLIQLREVGVETNLKKEVGLFLFSLFFLLSQNLSQFAFNFFLKGGGAKRKAKENENRVGLTCFHFLCLLLCFLGHNLHS